MPSMWRVYQPRLARPVPPHQGNGSAHRVRWLCAGRRGGQDWVQHRVRPGYPPDQGGRKTEVPRASEGAGAGSRDCDWPPPAEGGGTGARTGASGGVYSLRISLHPMGAPLTSWWTLAPVTSMTLNGSLSVSGVPWRQLSG